MIGSPAPKAIDADAAGAPHGEASEHEGDALGDVGLEPDRGPERHRRRDVEQRSTSSACAPERAVRTCGCTGARRRGGVEVADVVARLVGPQLRELRAPADAGGAAVTGQASAATRRTSSTSIASTSARGIGAGPWRPAAAGRRAAATITRRAPRARWPGLRLGDRDEQPLDHRVGRQPVAERLIGEHDAVAQHVGRRSRTSSPVTWPRPRSRARTCAARRRRARSARAGSRRTRSPPRARRARGGRVAARVGERDRVADHVAVDEHRARRGREALQVVERDHLAHLGRLRRGCARPPRPPRPAVG